MGVLTLGKVVMSLGGGGSRWSWPCSCSHEGHPHFESGEIPRRLILVSPAQSPGSLTYIVARMSGTVWDRRTEWPKTKGFFRKDGKIQKLRASIMCQTKNESQVGHLDLRLLGETVEKVGAGVPIVAQWKWTWLVSIRRRVQSLASFSGLRIWLCHELWCRLQTRLGILHCCDCGLGRQVLPGNIHMLWVQPSKTKERKKKKKRQVKVNLFMNSRPLSSVKVNY